MWTSLKFVGLTLSKMTNFGLFQTYRVDKTTISVLMKMWASFTKQVKNTGKRRIACNRETRACLEKGLELNIILTADG